MKIAYAGVDLPEGKSKYNDPIIKALVDQFKPDKVSPYFFEYLPEGYEHADAIVVHADSVLDLLILDMERVETRIERSDDPAEQAALRKCLPGLEAETPVCDIDLDETETEYLRVLAPFSFKPTLVIDEQAPSPDELVVPVMAKAGKMFFYTAGKQEVRSWFVDVGSDAVTCAGRIHSDLARGFIKAEIASVDDMLTVHGFPEARSKGLSKLVDRDYVIEPNTVLEIRFNV